MKLTAEKLPLGVLGSHVLTIGISATTFKSEMGEGSEGITL